jgi:hypothetical protein
MYDRMIENSELASSIVVILALLYLVVGLARPAWAFARGRGAVVLRSGLAMVFAAVLFIGVIAYTHSQPDGPHSVEGYINDYFAEQGAPPAQAAP